MLDADDTDPDIEGNDEGNPVISKLRSKAEQADRLADENEKLRTKLALSEAGLGHLNAKQQKALIAAHDGDPTPEAFKATAADLGFGAAATAEPEPQVPATEQQQHAQAGELTAGAPPAGGAEPPSFQDRYAAATTLEELDALDAELNEALRNVQPQ